MLFVESLGRGRGERFQFVAHARVLVGQQSQSHAGVLPSRSESPVIGKLVQPAGSSG